MKRLRMLLEYKGTAYLGWQRQPQGPTVQERLEEAIRRITGERPSVVGASRTDAGVHARGQVAAFDTECPLGVERFHMALNAVLPRDIVVLQMEEAAADFNPRFAARSKWYRYTIWSHRLRPVFGVDECWHLRWPLDLDLMNDGAALFVGRHDFGAFEGAESQSADSVRTVLSSAWKREAQAVVFDIEADGFLYNMVRSIVGTLVEVGRGKMPLAALREAFTSRDRRRTGPTAPACGLCLMEVRY